MFTSVPFPQTGESEVPQERFTSANAFLAFSLQCGSTLPSTAAFLDLLLAGRLAPRPPWQSPLPFRHRMTHFVATFLRSPHATWRTSVRHPLVICWPPRLRRAAR